MSDLINRTALLKHIEVKSGMNMPEWLRETINEMPSAQPEIIRCKDCIWFDRYTDGIEKYQWDGFCAEWARNSYEDWYCSRAERRTE